MDENEFPDLIEEAARSAIREAIEVASVAGVFTRAVLRRHARMIAERAAQSEQEQAAARAQQEAERAATRAHWVPANDPAWLGGADLLDTAMAWCAAVPYANPDAPGHEVSALSAVRNCEARLRELHPHAMARYDRLRADSQDELDAMRQAAPLFMRRPDIHERPGVTRRVLESGTGSGYSWASIPHGPGREEYDAYQAAAKVMRRGLQILHGMQTRAARTGMPSLGDEDQRVALELATNLPAEVIGRLTTRRPWEQDFPFPIEEILAIARTGTAPSSTPAKSPAVTNQRRLS